MKKLEIVTIISGISMAFFFFLMAIDFSRVAPNAMWIVAAITMASWIGIGYASRKKRRGTLIGILSGFMAGVTLSLTVAMSVVLITATMEEAVTAVVLSWLFVVVNGFIWFGFALAKLRSHIKDESGYGYEMAK